MSNRTRKYKHPLETTTEFVEAVHMEKMAVDHLAQITAKLETDPTNPKIIAEFNKAQHMYQHASGQMRITPRYVRKHEYEPPVNLGK